MKVFVNLGFLLAVGGAVYGQTVDELKQRAEQYAREGQFKNALKEIKTALEQAPEDYYLHLECGHYHQELEQFQEAYDSYTRAIDLDLNKSYGWSNRGVLLINLGELEHGVTDLKKALVVSETDSIRCKMHNTLGAALAYTRSYEDAYEHLIKSHQCDTTNVEVLVNLGAVCDKVGREDEAFTYLFKAVALEPTFFAIYGNIGFRYQEKGEYEKAIEYFEKVLELKPNEPQTIGNIAYNRYKLGHFSQALKDANKSIKLYPENPYTYRTRALIYLELEKSEKACEDLQRALDRQFTELHGNSVLELQEKHCPSGED